MNPQGKFKVQYFLRYSFQQISIVTESERDLRNLKGCAHNQWRMNTNIKLGSPSPMSCQLNHYVLPHPGEKTMNSMNI
jgi:hypothetical protein